MPREDRKRYFSHSKNMAIYPNFELPKIGTIVAGPSQDGSSRPRVESVWPLFSARLGSPPRRSPNVPRWFAGPPIETSGEPSANWGWELNNWGWGGGEADRFQMDPSVAPEMICGRMVAVPFGGEGKNAGFEQFALLDGHATCKANIVFSKHFHQIVPKRHPCC